MEKPTDPRIVRLREKVMAMVAALAALVSRHDGTAKALTKNEAELSAAQADAAKHSTAREELENLSAVGLHRRGMSAKDATAQADDLKGLEGASLDRAAKASDERERLSEQRTADFDAIEKLLPSLNYESDLLVESEFVAECGAMIDLQTEHVPALTEGTIDRLFAKTKAFAIYENRKRRIAAASAQRDKTQAVLAVAQEMVAQPLVPIKQHAPQLPHPNNCVLVRSIEQAVEAPVDFRPAVFRDLPPGQTSE